MICRRGGWFWADGGVHDYPWYLIMFMTTYQAPKEIKYEIDLGAVL